MSSKMLAFLLAILAFGFGMSAGCRDDDDPLARPSTVSPGPDPGPTPTPDPAPEPGIPTLGFEVQTSGTLTPIRAISVVDANTAFAAGGGILRTLDGGATWTPATGGNFIQLEFMDPMNGFAITQQQILTTFDSGTTFAVRKTALDNPFTSMSFISPTAGFVATENNEILRTIDGGATFDSFPVAVAPAAPVEGIRAIEFVDGATGWLAAIDPETGGQAIFKTVNGGVTWEKQFVVGVNLISDLEAIDAQRVVAVGSLTAGGFGEVILATNDGGLTWTEQHVGGLGGLAAVRFVNSLEGFAVGDRILRTTNGGLTWTAMTLPVEGVRFLGLDFVSPTQGFVVGSDGTILRTTTTIE